MPGRPRRDAGSSAQRFRATIRRQGINPYVDVPLRISREFARYARQGRILVEGTLNATPIRGTLIPVGEKRHRFFVNGGMRSAADVGPGDTAVFSLRATRPAQVRVPPDVAAPLRKVKGAAAAFNALSPAHRRQLLRFIDDARSPATREKRIRSTIGHVLGESRDAKSRVKKRPLWTCSKCGNEFVNRNAYHSCKRYELSDLFSLRSAAIRTLFDRFHQMVRACGPVKVLPYRDKVGFMVRVRFAAAIPRVQWLDVVLRLTRRVEHARFHRIETIQPNNHGHFLRVSQPEQLDDEVAAWVKEAYTVGCQGKPKA